MEIRILFEDEQIIVCEKPAGVAVQTKRLGQADMESLLKNRRAGKGELPVSGVMVFAKTKEAAAALSRQIASGLADKFYYAVTDGVPEAGKGQFTDYLLRDGRTNTSAVVESSTPGAKRAELSYEVLEQKNGRAVLRIQLGTGRHHQIRVQLAHAGMPIVGDRKYNFKENMKPSGEPLCLCSYKIGFRHPKTRRNLAFEIDNPFHLS